MNASGTARRMLTCALFATLAVSCKGRNSATSVKPVAGLAAVPVTATAVVSIDVTRVAGAPLVERAVQQLLLRDVDLSERWLRLRDECKLDVGNDIQQVVLALGPKVEGSAAVLMVVTGKLAEAGFASCVRSLVGKGGGTLSATTANGRTVYQAREGERSVWFGFSRADTVVLSSQQAFVSEALGPGAKAAENPELKSYLAVVDQKQPVWAAGQVDSAIAERLLRPSGGALKAGPRGFVMSADASAGFTGSIGAVMATVDDAKALEGMARQQLGLLAMAAQVKSLGRLVGKITAASDGKLVRLAVALDPTEINQLLSAVDSAGTGSQDAPPAAPSQPSP